jgi:hypothetical protein
VKKCPYCTADIPLEAKKCKHCGEWVEPRDPPASDPAELKLTLQPPTRGPTKPCPYCSALIPANAWTCMYCKRGVIGGRPLAIGVVVLVFLVVMIFTFAIWLPGWNKARKEHEDMRRNFPSEPGFNR